MIHLIVGHRGSGKTSFLRRIDGYYKGLGLQVAVFDLDEEISKQSGKSIAQIFNDDGEKFFRELEITTLNRLVSQCRSLVGHVYIALGAGFEGEMPIGVEVIWVKRDTDATGRIFLDRPRLDAAMDPLVEYQNRYTARDARYSRWCTKEIVIPEGWDRANDWESRVLGLRPAKVSASITLMPDIIRNPLRLESFIHDCLALGVRFIELRDDLLSTAEILTLIQELPAEKILLSFRNRNTDPALLELHQKYTTDWALELGAPAFAPSISSVHERQKGESFAQVVERLLTSPGVHKKLAVEVKDFTELWMGHKFLQESYGSRSFQPRSSSGRWKWYRLLQNAQMHLNFFRMGTGSAADQPALLEILRENHRAEQFAAVLGDPVAHSLTPATHYDYFKKHSMPVVAIQMSEAECNPLILNVLYQMGLRAAAVTSPLKNKILEYCQQVEKQAEELGSVNTIIYNPKISGWVGANTDVLGLEKILGALELPDDVVVWGGGGTRTSLRKLLPNAFYFSARYGEPIWIEKPTLIPPPQAVVWAVPRARMSTTKLPPSDWRPECVVDLNYNEDSPGKEYAMHAGAKYISGRSFFQAQAAAQREFWQKTELLT